MTDFFSIPVQSIDGASDLLGPLRGKVIFAVNVASRCGFTPQYQGLEKLYRDYRTQGFEILGFPCNQFGRQEPGTESQIKDFCDGTYHVTFPLFSKVEVNGPNAHPLYKFLEDARPGILGTKRIKWNFTKFLIDREGRPARRYSPRATPQNIAPDIERQITLGR